MGHKEEEEDNRLTDLTTSVVKTSTLCLRKKHPRHFWL